MKKDSARAENPSPVFQTGLGFSAIRDRLR